MTRAGLSPVERVGRVADLALPGQEHQDVARPLAHQLADRLDDAGGLVVDELAVADLDRVHPTGHLDDRRVVEVPREALRVDGRRRDDDLEVRPARQQLLEVAEDEVDVEAALVCLVDDDRVVATQHPVPLDLGEQDAVGHDLDQRAAARAVGEPDLVADDVAELGAELLGDALGDAAGRDPPRLGVADHGARTGHGRARGRSWAAGWSCRCPVSPATITTWWSLIAAAMSSRRCETGSSSGYRMVHDRRAVARRRLAGPRRRGRCSPGALPWWHPG